MPTQPSRYRLTRNYTLRLRATGQRVGQIVKGYDSVWEWRCLASGADGQANKRSAAQAALEASFEAWEAGRSRDADAA